MNSLKLVLVVALLQFVQVNGWFLKLKKPQKDVTKVLPRTPLPPLPAMVADLSDPVRRA